MTANPPSLPVLVRCVEDCDEGRVECPGCGGHKELAIRVRPRSYHSVDPEDGLKFSDCPRCDGAGTVRCETCNGLGAYPDPEKCCSADAKCEWCQPLTQYLPEAF